MKRTAKKKFLISKIFFYTLIMKIVINDEVVQCLNEERLKQIKSTLQLNLRNY